MTHKLQAQVEAFHTALDLPVGEKPHIPTSRRWALRYSLIMEELDELDDAMAANNLPAAIDAVCDLLYVVYGTAVEMGLDIEPFADEVHAANMRKTGGPRRLDGKVLKPEGWRPPDIEGVLTKVADTENVEGEMHCYAPDDAVLEGPPE